MLFILFTSTNDFFSVNKHRACFEELLKRHFMLLQNIFLKTYFWLTIIIFLCLNFYKMT